MDPIQQYAEAVNRRHFFKQGALGLGSAALASLLPQQLLASVASTAQATGGLPGLPHFAPKAKRAIYLFMAGGPSQMDMFDYKPKMADWFDKDLPESVRMGQRLTTMTSVQSRFPLAPSKYKFQQFGKSGAWISELLPYHAAWLTTSPSSNRSIPRRSIMTLPLPSFARAINCPAEPVSDHGSATAWAR